MENSQMQGGYLMGNSHANGGIKIKTPEGQIEAEGGEVIINKRVMALDEKFVCEGTPREITSKVNEMEGGVSWSETGSCRIMKKAEDGSEIEEEITLSDDGFGVLYVSGGKNYIVTADTKDQAEIIEQSIKDFKDGFITKDELENTLQSYMNDDHELAGEVQTIGGKPYVYNDFYAGYIPVMDAEAHNIDYSSELGDGGSIYGDTLIKAANGVNLDDTNVRGQLSLMNIEYERIRGDYKIGNIDENEYYQYKKEIVNKYLPFIKKGKELGVPVNMGLLHNTNLTLSNGGATTETASQGSILRSSNPEKRPSPSVSATIYPAGFQMEGNDGNIWEIALDSRGIHRWKKVKGEDGLDIAEENAFRHDPMEIKFKKEPIVQWDGKAFAEAQLKAIKERRQSAVLYCDDTNGVPSEDKLRTLSEDEDYRIDVDAMNALYSYEFYKNGNLVCIPQIEVFNYEYTQEGGSSYRNMYDEYRGAFYTKSEPKPVSFMPTDYSVYTEGCNLSDEDTALLEEHARIIFNKFLKDVDITESSAFIITKDKLNAALKEGTELAANGKKVTKASLLKTVSDKDEYWFTPEGRISSEKKGTANEFIQHEWAKMFGANNMKLVGGNDKEYVYELEGNPMMIAAATSYLQEEKGVEIETYGRKKRVHIPKKVIDSTSAHLRYPLITPFANGGGVGEKDEYEIRVVQKEVFVFGMINQGKDLLYVLEYRKKRLFSSWKMLALKTYDKLDEFGLSTHYIKIKNSRITATKYDKSIVSIPEIEIYEFYQNKEDAENTAKLLSENNDKLLKAVLKNKEELLNAEKNNSKTSYFDNGGGLGNQGLLNKNYLDSIPAEKKAFILKGIAEHYGISVERVLEEVTNNDAEELADYIPGRGALEVFNAMKSMKMTDGGGVEENPSITITQDYYDEKGDNSKNPPLKYSVNYLITFGKDDFVELTGSLKPIHTGRDYEYEFEPAWFADTEEAEYYDEHHEEIEKQILDKFYTMNFANGGGVEGSKIIGNALVVEDFRITQYDFPKMNWKSAIKSCSDLGEGWRLPTKKELELIFGRGVRIGKKDQLYWTATEVSNMNGYVWSVEHSSLGGVFAYSGNRNKEDECIFLAIRVNCYGDKNEQRFFLNGGGVDGLPENYYQHAISRDNRIYTGDSYIDIISQQSPNFFHKDISFMGYVDKLGEFYDVQVDNKYAEGGGVPQAKYGRRFGSGFSGRTNREEYLGNGVWGDDEGNRWDKNGKTISGYGKSGKTKEEEYEEKYGKKTSTTENDKLSKANLIASRIAAKKGQQVTEKLVQWVLKQMDEGKFAADGKQIEQADILTNSMLSILDLFSYISMRGNKIVIQGSTYTYSSHGKYNLRVTGGKGATYNIVPYFPEKHGKFVDANFYSLIRQKVNEHFAITKEGELIDVAEDGTEIKP